MAERFLELLDFGVGDGVGCVEEGGDLVQFRLGLGEFEFGIIHILC